MVEVQAAQRCPSCGTELSRERWSKGLCPACLIELALDDTALEAELAERTERITERSRFLADIRSVVATRVVGQETMVERLQLNPDNSGRWSIELDPDQSAVLILSGLTRVTTEPAGYWYKITSYDEVLNGREMPRLSASGQIGAQTADKDRISDVNSDGVSNQGQGGYQSSLGVGFEEAAPWLNESRIR